MPAIENKQQVCKECGSNYEAHTAKLIGNYMDFSGGYCEVCRKVKLDQEKALELEAETKRLNARKVKWQQESGIPLRFQKSSFHNFDTKVDKSILQVYRECEEYAIRFSFENLHSLKSLVMFSVRVWGQGKTHLACSIANAILDKWRDETALCPVYFIREPQLFLNIRATYNRVRKEGDDDRHLETEEEIYKKLTTVPLLILDDVGKEEVADPRFVQRVLFNVIDGRYGNMLPMIITANLDTDGLDNHLGGRNNSASIERLIEMTGNVFWELKGTTYRDISKRRK